MDLQHTNSSASANANTNGTASASAAVPSDQSTQDQLTVDQLAAFTLNQADRLTDANILVLQRTTDNIISSEQRMTESWKSQMDTNDTFTSAIVELQAGQAAVLLIEKETQKHLLKLKDEIVELSSKVVKLEADNRTLRDDIQALRAANESLEARLSALEKADQAEAGSDAERESERTDLSLLISRQIVENARLYSVGQPTESEPPRFTDLDDLDCYLEEIEDDVAEEEPEAASSPSIFSWFWGGRSS